MKPSIDMVTIPVKDIGQSAEFYRHIFKLDEDSISKGDDHIALFFRHDVSLVLFDIQSFAEMTEQEIGDVSTASLILNQNVDSKEAVDQMIVAASEYGGKVLSKGQTDEWGYSAKFKDLDGVTWEIVSWNE